MKKPESRTVFAGVDGHAETQLPEWYAQRYRDIETVSFAEAVRSLPRATEATVAYRNPLTNRWIETNRFNAIVEPSRLRDQARGDDLIEPLFHIPSDSYSILNPVDVYGPLEDVLREETIEEVALGDILFGEIRQYRSGGEVHMDVLFDGLKIELPDRSDPIRSRWA